MTLRIAFICSVLSSMLIAHPVDAQQEVSSSVLAMEYVGPHDKTITPIVISDSKAGVEWYRDAVLRGGGFRFINMHVVRASLMATLIKDAEKYRDVTQQGPANQMNSSGTVSVTVLKSHVRNTFLLSSKSALLLIDDRFVWVELGTSYATDVLDDNEFYPWVVPGVGKATSNNTIKFSGAGGPPFLPCLSRPYITEGALPFP